MSLGALLEVQKEVVNTLIKRELQRVFFFLRNKNVNSNFSPSFPLAAFGLSGIHIHFGFDLLSSLNEFIQTMWIYSDLSQIPHLLWLIKLTSAKKSGSVRFEIHIGNDTGFAGNNKAQSNAVGRKWGWAGESLVRPSWLPALPRIHMEKHGKRWLGLCNGTCLLDGVGDDWTELWASASRISIRQRQPWFTMHSHAAIFTRQPSLIHDGQSCCHPYLPWLLTPVEKNLPQLFLSTEATGLGVFYFFLHAIQSSIIITSIPGRWHWS